jgi:isoprenylcysteine carboxyl methyltransferase (ICMT) family protein YpbQ
MKFIQYMSKNKLIVIVSAFYFVTCVLFVITKNNHLSWSFGPLTLFVLVIYLLEFYKYRLGNKEQD